MKLRHGFPTFKAEFRKQSKEKEIEESWRLWERYRITLCKLEKHPKGVRRVKR